MNKEMKTEDFVIKLKNKILEGYLINKSEALTLVHADLDILCGAADEIRKHFAEMILIYVPLLMPKAENAPKTVSIALSLRFIIPQRKNIPCWSRRKLSGRESITVNAVSGGTPL